jgi:hypothetical protein
MSLRPLHPWIQIAFVALLCEIDETSEFNYVCSLRLERFEVSICSVFTDMVSHPE